MAERIMYDEEEDILFLSKGRKVKASVDIGDFIVDVDMKGFVSGIEILNASENLRMTTEQLRLLEKASMSVSYRHKSVYIFLSISGKEVSIPLTLDLGHGPKTENISFACP